MMEIRNRKQDMRARLRLFLGAAAAGLLLALPGCGDGPPVPSEPGQPAGHEVAARQPTIDVISVEEAWMTERDPADNVDSVAVWTSGEFRWLIATAKETDVLLVHDAATGERIDRIGGTGNAPGRFLRPNGIFVIDDRVWVVERDNRRVQVLSLPGFEPEFIFGAEQLTRPYGLWIHRTEGGFRVFVTDAYETADEQVPPDDELGRRLHRFDIVSTESGLEAAGHRTLGPVEGRGRLLKVESLWGDPAHDRLLVADEHASRLNLKEFDLEGRFTGKTFADGILEYEPEGIALYRCADGSGYWIVTDQDEVSNRFLVFRRRTPSLAGAFTGAATRNTDGVWLHQVAMPGFPNGVFYAVHDDGNVAAFDWKHVLEALGLAQCKAGSGSSVHGSGP